MFRAMKARDVRGTWESLTLRSRDTIVEETRRALESAGERTSGDMIRDDFREGGPVSNAYWDAYLAHFDPESALSGSRWEMGEVAQDRAEVRITYKTSERPAVLMMRREGGRWRVGLVETFWGRR